MNDLKSEKEYRIFRSLWWLVNLLVVVTLLCTTWAGSREYSLRRYLSGFSNAIIPQADPPQEKVEAILDWMRYGPPRLEAKDLNQVPPHDPTETLNYRQLLEVCGSTTNAFLNLSRSSGLQTRRLSLLTPDRNTKHVVAEVLLDGRWVIVDATYRVMMKDAHGKLLTRKELQDPAIFRGATSLIPNYVQEYSYREFRPCSTGDDSLARIQRPAATRSFLPGLGRIPGLEPAPRAPFFPLFLSILQCTTGCPDPMYHFRLPRRSPFPDASLPPATLSPPGGGCLLQPPEIKS
jgi:hypothetical protein